MDAAPEDRRPANREHQMTSAEPLPIRVPLAEKVRFMMVSADGRDGEQAARSIETHMSWVFLRGKRAYKLKKPVRYDFLDFSTLAAREFNCREEIRLNRRLATDIYLGVLPMYADIDGQLSLGAIDPMVGTADPSAHHRTPPGRVVVDWLVLMLRLPADRMLDSQIVAGTVTPAQVDRLGDRLISFYRDALVVRIDARTYVERQYQNLAEHRRVLLDPRFASLRASEALDRYRSALADRHAALAERACGGHIREGHGDLRPEHVLLVQEPAAIDCLEFNRALREIDPFDEIAYLGLECRLLGADWIGPRLIDRCAAGLGAPPPSTLISLYGAGRALLRARLVAAHLLEPEVRTPRRWMPQARRYLALAQRLLRQC